MSIITLLAIIAIVWLVVANRRSSDRLRSPWEDFEQFLEVNELTKEGALALLESAGKLGRFRSGRKTAIHSDSAMVILDERARIQQRNRGEESLALKSAAYGAIASVVVAQALEAAPKLVSTIEGLGFSMTQAELVSKTARDAGLTQADAGRILEAIVREIHRSLASGSDVRISNLGVFDTTWRAPREGRNPATGAVIHIPAGRAVRFRVSKALADAIQ